MYWVSSKKKSRKLISFYSHIRSCVQTHSRSSLNLIKNLLIAFCSQSFFVWSSCDEIGSGQSGITLFYLGERPHRRAYGDSKMFRMKLYAFSPNSIHSEPCLNRNSLFWESAMQTAFEKIENSSRIFVLCALLNKFLKTDLNDWFC